METRVERKYNAYKHNITSPDNLSEKIYKFMSNKERLCFKIRISSRLEKTGKINKGINFFFGGSEK